MKFVVNTTYIAAGTVVLEGIVRRLIASGHKVTRNEWENYHGYDIALFMAPDSKVREAKRVNPKIIVGIFDPKMTTRRQRIEVKAADFVIVSSIEQRDFFLQFNPCVFIYYMFPEVLPTSKQKGDKIVIGYHGNKQHLDAMEDVSRALDALAMKYPIEFHAIYNIKKLGKWNKNVPKYCPVVHVQWNEANLSSSLAMCTIGITPSVLSVPKFFTRPFSSFFSNKEGYNKYDYITRYKPSNNPGRLYVFAELSIPVVADFSPSACQMIRDGYSGRIAGTTAGWERALEDFITNPTLRTECAKNLKNDIATFYSPERTLIQCLEFIRTLYEQRQ